MKKISPIFFFALCFIPLRNHANEMPLIGGPSYLQQAINEEQKINQLILCIEKMDAQFIRNGSSYSSTEAAKHLKMKREKAGGKIKTAKDFIDYVASKSSVSGEPYQLKFKNGSVFLVRDVLYFELKKMEAKQVGYHKGIKLVKGPAC